MIMCLFLSMALTFFSPGEPRAISLPTGLHDEPRSRMNCNGALQYYLALLNALPTESLPIEEQKLLDNVETCPPDNSLIPLLVARYAESLAYLRLGSNCPECDWGT